MKVEISDPVIKNNFLSARCSTIKNIWCKFTSQKLQIMARQSITLAKQNDEWLKNQVAQQEFTSKSEAVNYLIKQAREREEHYDYVRMKIEKGEKSGFAKKQTREEMLTEFKKKLNV